MKPKNKPKPFFLKKVDKEDGDIDIFVAQCQGNPFAENWYEEPEINIYTLGERSISAKLTSKEARKLADWLNGYANWADGKTPNKGD